MPGTSHITTDHEEIRAWIEQRNGTPVEVSNPGGDPGGSFLQVEFPGYDRGEYASPISWDQFFQKFEERSLAFQYQEESASGSQTHFFKLIDRDDAGGASRANLRGGISETGGHSHE